MCAKYGPRDPRGADSAAAAEGAVRGLDRGERARVRSDREYSLPRQAALTRGFVAGLSEADSRTSRSRSCRFNVVTSAATSDEPFRSGPHQRRHLGKAGLLGRSAAGARRPAPAARRCRHGNTAAAATPDAARSTRQLVQPGQRRSRISAEGHDNPTRNAPQITTADLDGGPDSDKRRRLRDAPAFYGVPGGPAPVVRLGCRRPARLDHDRDDHDCATDERERGRALVEREPHPEGAENDLEQRG